ncbi:response regulator [Halobacillus sp. Nhm2S1]|uniref:response regulator n=1 Tax=Halobacillus sp. Nhm2S1 TaxID=2866716 RepID=UPI001C73C349|nr:response regulator [Halobacillus sp. Nhm2S1]MBX0357602.1 response regulator [Halobacillus sp. Nhm2S1]
MRKQRSDIRVLLIEDDPMVQEVNRQFIERVEGYHVVAIASNGEEGLKLIREHQPDLVILDIYMPALDGRQTLQELRRLAFDVEVMVITAANDKSMIRSMFQYGVVDYIIKPFKFERLERALLDYKNFRTRMTGEGGVAQEQLDTLFNHAPSSKGMNHLPKGLNQQTLNQILDYLKQDAVALSAEEVADGLGMARVTARRYLDYLQKNGQLNIDIQYGGVGRPVNRYQVKP